VDFEATNTGALNRMRRLYRAIYKNSGDLLGIARRICFAIAEAPAVVFATSSKSEALPTTSARLLKPRSHPLHLS
jgi:hypothetical protein